MVHLYNTKHEYRVHPDTIALRVACGETVRKPRIVAEGEDALKVPDLCPVCNGKMLKKPYLYAIDGEKF